MKLPLPIVVLVQQAVNSITRLDPDTSRALDRIDGKVIRIQVSDFDMDVTLSVVDRHVEVLRIFDGDVDTVVSGSLNNLLSLRESNDALYRGDVRIEGDMAVGQELRDILGAVHVDWEQLISPVLGDSAAQQLGQMGEQFTEWFKRSRSRVRQNSSDYLQEDAELLAVKGEVQRFCNEVDELRADVDRLEARLQLIEAQAE
jgi:ubiquinone biosynthesis protein UbiJ